MKLLLATTLGIAFLFVFYRAVQIEWPASYFGATDISAYSMSRRPVRYLVYRFAPVHLTCLFVAVTLSRLESSALWGSLAVAVGHAALTSGSALFRWTRASFPARRGRRSIAVLRLAELVGIAVVGLVAWATKSWLAPLVPAARDLAVTLWTALFAGVVGAYVVGLSRGHGVGDDELIRQSIREIPSKLWEAAGVIAAEYGADPSLVRAVMAVENLQRPSWFRRLEVAAAGIMRQGTYGIMQISSEKPLSDEDSIRLAVAERFREVSVIGSEGYPDPDQIERFARGYNSNPEFGQLLESAYYAVREKEERG